MNSDCCPRLCISFLSIFFVLATSPFFISCNQKTSETGTEKIDTVKPDDNRFTPVKLTAEGDLDEPMNFEVVKDGRVFINERKGTLKVFNPIDKTVSLVGTIPVNTKYTSKEGKVTEAEEGFIGFTV